MTTLPLISIVVPNMSGMEHLPECFASLAAADYPLDRQEWILSDNGSRDEFAGLYPPRVSAHAHRG